MSTGRAARAEPQTTATVLMVRPARFGSNPETAATNAFQRAGSSLPAAEVLERARREFDGLVRALREQGVDVLVVDDTPEPAKPDAVFPNNWVSFHPDGTVVLYPLLAESRRPEVRLDVLEELERRGLFARRRLLDLRPLAPAFLEGTGSLVLDRTQRLAYACLSPRTSPAALDAFCRELGYEPIAFHAVDARGMPIYHTNVMLAIGERVAVVCLASIRDAREREEVVRRLTGSGHELVPIDLGQMEGFAGNLLELRSRDGRALFVLSERARRSLRAEELAVLARHGTLLSVDLDTIETHGGGSARCMLAEVFGPAATGSVPGGPVSAPL